MLGLDLVPRVEWEPVNVNTLSPVDLFFLHYRSSASTNASSVKQTLPSNVQFLVAIVGCIMFLIQHSYLHFSNALFFALYLLSSCDFTLFISLIVFFTSLYFSSILSSSQPLRLKQWAHSICRPDIILFILCYTVCVYWCMFGYVLLLCLR